ncbi:MAG: T9SS type A sorting domain-containing protein [Ignavibacteriae bacterium]|nr:T9SS type A sorting domain-containing protein [Ignavibacteriota bacterium]
MYPRSIVLRATPVGQTRDTTFHIRNTGIDTLKVQDILTSTPDFLVKLRQATIPPGQAYEDTVRFTPTSAVAYSAKIVIVSNSVTSPDTVLVSTSGVASVALEGQSPKEFLIDQNFPNPFNPSTTIRYGLPNRSHVTLLVFNTLGQQVSILQNGDQEAGYHEVRFDGANLPSGVYFYRMQTGSFTETKKFLLVR